MSNVIKLRNESTDSLLNALIDAVQFHLDKIAWWFSQTFYDDITHLMKSVLSRMDWQTAEVLYTHLFSVYRRTYEETDAIREEFRALGLPPEKLFLKPQDEILYFNLRLPHIDHDAFVCYAYEKALIRCSF